MKKLPREQRSRRFCRAAAICAAGMMLILYGMTGLAAQKGTNHVDNVNVRTEASAESERVCKIPMNTELTIVDQTTGSDGNVWYSITFTHEGQEKSGWIRSDMVTVTETQEQPEEEGSVPEEGGAAAPAGGYSIQEPVEEFPASNALSQTGLQAGETNVTAWVVDAGLTGGRELYLVWAADSSGSQGWFYYDPQEGTFQREMGQFSGGGAGESGGMIESLQSELADRKDEYEAGLSQRLYIIIGLGVLSGILLIIVIILAVKLRNSEYEYYDEDEDEEDEDEDDDYDDYDDEDTPRKKRGGLFRRRVKEEEEEEEEAEASDFDDLLVAVRKKWAEEEERERSGSIHQKEEEEFQEEEMEEGMFSTKKLPEIDMSAVLEVEEAAKEKHKKKSQSSAARLEAEEDDIDDMDIEILDIEDLDI